MSTGRRELAPGRDLAFPEAASGSGGGGRAQGVCRQQPKVPWKSRRGVSFTEEWPVTVLPTAQVLGVSPGCRGLRGPGGGAGKAVRPHLRPGLQSTATHTAHPPVGMHPGHSSEDTRGSACKGSLSLPLSQSQGSGRQLRQGEAKCALPPGKESPGTPERSWMFSFLPFQSP